MRRPGNVTGRGAGPRRGAELNPTVLPAAATAATALGLALILGVASNTVKPRP